MYHLIFSAIAADNFRLTVKQRYWH